MSKAPKDEMEDVDDLLGPVQKVLERLVLEASPDELAKFLAALRNDYPDADVDEVVKVIRRKARRG
jgi:hypothetical protein